MYTLKGVKIINDKKWGWGNNFEIQLSFLSYTSDTEYSLSIQTSLTGKVQCPFKLVSTIHYVDTSLNLKYFRLLYKYEQKRNLASDV